MSALGALPGCESTVVVLEEIEALADDLGEDVPTVVRKALDYFRLARMIPQLTEPNDDPPKRIGHYHRSVLAHLLLLSDNRTRRVTVGQDRLADDFGIGKSTTRGALTDLDRWG